MMWGKQQDTFGLRADKANILSAMITGCIGEEDRHRLYEGGSKPQTFLTIADHVGRCGFFSVDGAIYLLGNKNVRLSAYGFSLSGGQTTDCPTHFWAIFSCCSKI